MTVLCTECSKPVDSRWAALVDHGTGYRCSRCKFEHEVAQQARFGLLQRLGALFRRG